MLERSQDFLMALSETVPSSESLPLNDGRTLQNVERDHFHVLISAPEMFPSFFLFHSSLSLFSFVPYFRVMPTVSAITLFVVTEAVRHGTLPGPRATYSRAKFLLTRKASYVCVYIHLYAFLDFEYEER